MSCARPRMAWFFVGVGVGAVVSLLLAPAAGEDLREKLASSAREGAENASQRETVETISDFVDRGREKINKVVNKGEDAAEEGRSQLNDYA
jgi:gas vesicle protein